MVSGFANFALPWRLANDRDFFRLRAWRVANGHNCRNRFAPVGINARNASVRFLHIRGRVRAISSQVTTVGVRTSSISRNGIIELCQIGLNVSV